MAPTIAVSDGPSPFSAGNFVTVRWGAVPNAAGYDVLKLVSNTWMLVGSTSPGNPPATSLTDSGRPTTEYNLPTHNETGHLQVGAFTATDSGAALPLAMPYNGLPGRYVAGVNHRTSLFQSLDSFDIGARIDCTATGGGVWDDPSRGTTGYLAVFANMVAGARGTNGVYFAYAKGLGAGDIAPYQADVEAWGGNGNLYATGPEAAACGEFDLAQGSHVDGRNIFQAKVTQVSPDRTTLTYSSTAKSTANEDALGCRYLLNHTRPTTTVGSVTAISPDATTKQTTVTFNGVSFSSSDVGKYLKIGSKDDLYSPPAQGDDVVMDGVCVGHWYRVIGVPAPNTLVLAGLYDTQAFKMPAPTARYILMEGAEIQAFDPSMKSPSGSGTITLQDGRNWVAGDVVYSPPHHLMAMTGLNIIINKKFKTTGAAVRSDTVRIFNAGPGLMDDAIWITGDNDTPGQTIGGFRTGILFSPCNAEVGIDMSSVHFDTGAIRINQDELIVLSQNKDATPHEKIYGGGDGIRLETSPGGRSLFATDNANSTFAVSHSALGEVEFVDGTGLPWLKQNEIGVTFQKQACSKRNVPAWSPTVTLDFSAGAVQQITLSGATTLLFSNILDGGAYTIHLVQDAIGGRTVGWPSNAKFPGPSNVPPVLSSQPSKRDIFKAVSDGTEVYIYTWALGF